MRIFKKEELRKTFLKKIIIQEKVQVGDYLLETGDIILVEMENTNTEQDSVIDESGITNETDKKESPSSYAGSEFTTESEKFNKKSIIEMEEEEEEESKDGGLMASEGVFGNNQSANENPKSIY